MGRTSLAATAIVLMWDKLLADTPALPSVGLGTRFGEESRFVRGVRLLVLADPPPLDVPLAVATALNTVDVLLA